MTQNQSYPSPNAAQIGGAAGPFFGQNGGLSPPNMSTDMQLSAELSRAAQPVMSSDANSVQDNGDPGTQLQHHTPIRQEPSPQQVAQGVMSLGEHPHPGFSTPQDAGSSSRKRSKVSRACDECRRKKIRCDASAENVTEACSSCRRTNVCCQFSRQPMKRGPSKGYIKELADKLTRLEESIAPRHLQYQQNSQPADLSYIHGLPDSALTQLQEFATSTASPISRKRTFSVSDESHEQYGAPQRSTMSGWPSHETSRNVPHTSSGASAVANQQSSPDNAAQTARSVRSNGGTLELDPVATLVEWDESTVNEHYRLVQPTLPFLPTSKERLRSKLGHCSPALRDAFLTALDCAVRSNPSSTVDSDGSLLQRMKQVFELISVFQYEPSGNKSATENLVYLQVLILIILATDNIGPAAIRFDAGPSRAEWLGRAVGMITHLKLNSISAREKFVGTDEDTDDKLGRRVYWSIFILDRWHAASISGLFQLPEHCSTLVAEDEVALGDIPYQLARISFIIGHLATIFATLSNSAVDDDIFGSRNSATHLLAISIQGELDRFRESVDKSISHAAVVQMAYWHTRLLVVRLHPSSSPQDLILPAQRVATLLNQAGNASFSPLSQHFAVLASVTLVELVALPETREDAIQGIEELGSALASLKSEASTTGAAGNGFEDGWCSSVLELLAKRKAQTSTDGQGPSLGLQHLADAAVGERSGEDGTAGVNGAASAPTTAAMQSTSSATVSAAAAAAAAATAVAVQQRMQEFDSMALARQGYLTAFIKESASTRQQP